MYSKHARGCAGIIFTDRFTQGYVIRSTCPTDQLGLRRPLLVPNCFCCCFFFAVIGRCGGSCRLYCRLLSHWSEYVYSPTESVQRNERYNAINSSLLQCMRTGNTILVRAALCRRCLTAVGHYFR